jgi:hypothetical protein
MSQFASATETEFRLFHLGVTFEVDRLRRFYEDVSDQDLAALMMAGQPCWYFDLDVCFNRLLRELLGLFDLGSNRKAFLQRVR